MAWSFSSELEMTVHLEVSYRRSLDEWLQSCPSLQQVVKDFTSAGVSRCQSEKQLLFTKALKL